MDWLNYLILALYFVLIFGIAFLTRKKSGNLNDFLLAGKGMSGIMTAFAYGTTYFSAVIFIGYAGKNGYNFGLAATWIGIGNAIIGSLLPWLLLAKRTRRMTHHFSTRTMPELFEARYQSKYIKLICASIIFVFLIPYSASVYQGLSYLFEQVFNIKFWIVVLIMAGITAVYLFFGGYFATVVTDFLQGLIMLAGVVVMIAFVLNHEKVGGAVEGFTRLFADELGFFKPLAGNKWYTLIAMVFLTSVGTWGLPQIVHKFYTVRSEKAVKQAAYVSSGFALIIGVCAYLAGCFARYILDAQTVGNLVATGQEDKIMPMVLIEALPAGLMGLIIVLILSASMSTLASLTLAGSSAVSVDLYKGYIKKDATDKQTNILMRSLCVVFIGVSVVIAIAKPASIISLMSISWGVLSGSFLAPYIYGLYSKKATKAGAYAGIFTGLGINVIMFIIGLILKNPTFSFYFSPPAVGSYSMMIVMIVMPIVSRFTKKPDEKMLDELFFKLKMTSDPQIEADKAETAAQ